VCRRNGESTAREAAGSCMHLQLDFKRRHGAPVENSRVRGGGEGGGGGAVVVFWYWFAVDYVRLITSWAHVCAAQRRCSTANRGGGEGGGGGGGRGGMGR
jgi:hypothetical protein